MFFPYLTILSRFRKDLIVFLFLFSWFSSSLSSLLIFFSPSSLLVSPPSVNFQAVLDPFSFHVFSCSTFPLTLPSLSYLRKAYANGVLLIFFWKKGTRVRTCNWTHATATIVFGKRKGHLPSLLAFIPPLKWEGVFGCWLSLVPIPLLSYPKAGFILLNLNLG